MAYGEYEDQTDDFDFDDDQSSGAQRQGGDAIGQLRATIKQLQKANKELTAKNQELSTVTRKQSLESVLRAKGVNVRLAELIPTEVEATDEGIGKWLEDCGDLFGAAAKPPADQPAATAEQATLEQSGVLQSPQVQAGAERMRQLENGGTPNADALLQLVNNAKNEQEIIDLIASQRAF